MPPSDTTGAAAGDMMLRMLGEACLEPEECFSGEGEYDVCFSHRKIPDPL